MILREKKNQKIPPKKRKFQINYSNERDVFNEVGEDRVSPSLTVLKRDGRADLTPQGGR
jgi:hypothetical protein